MLILIPLIFLEIGLRTIYSIKLGPRLLLYGTRFSNYYVDFRKDKYWARRAEKDHTVMIHQNKKSNYSKYFPNETKRDWGEDGEVFEVSINSRGFRGKEFSTKRKEEVVRIITLGASSAFGYKDRDNETYPYYMEEILKLTCVQK